MQPNFAGCLTEVRLWARERSAALDLPVVEVADINPDLTAKCFLPPAIYIKITKFDELAPGEFRVFRHN